MSNVSPPSNRSRSPRQSAHRSARNSPRSSPKRRPLHERSDSEANAAGLTVAAREDVGNVYNKNVFPSLPSQIFPPPSQYERYLYEDENAAPSDVPSLPQRSSLRSLTSSSRPSSGKGKGRSDGAAKSSRGDWENDSIITPSDSIVSPRTDAGAPWDSRSVGRADTQHRSWPLPDPLVYADGDPPAGSSVEEDKVDKDQFSRYTFYRPNSLEPPPPPVRASGYEPPHGLRRVQRLRSPSESSSLAPKPLRLARSTSFGSTDAPRQSQDRPRSATNPDGPPTEAFLEALIQSGTNIQYPVLRKPSATSLRTTTSSSRGAYPAPLRLQRKRAHSHLSRAASGADSNGHAQSSATGAVRYPRLKPSQSSNSMVSTVSSVPEVPSQPQQRGLALSGAWFDESNDTVSDLYYPTLQPRRSAHRLQPPANSRPASEHSTSSRPGHFYSFLNDSVTAWAHFYYQGDDRWRFGSSPEVTTVERPKTPSARLNGSSNTSGPSTSPPSAGFPDAIYIPRVRPLRQRSESFTTVDESEISALPEVRPSSRPTPPSQVVEAAPITQTEQQREQLPPQSFNRTPELPHLSPDKRVTMYLPLWDAPSFDDERVGVVFVWNQTNRQILLFCAGFIFPLCWMMASILPIPPRPEMIQVDPRGPYDREVTLNDLFNRQEILKYQKTRWWRNLNRWMSLTGICVIAAVIACAAVATK